jgi:stage II sporulation protein GA (sporulation sigma-E factor processing peptidase)
LERRKEKSFLHTLKVEGQTLLALLDTGNSLYDPITLLPVILCQWDSLPLPEELLQATLHKDASALPRLSKQFPHLKLRLLPYTDATGARTLIYAFRPRELSVDGIERQALIGITLQPLSPDNRFQALLHRDWSNL